MGRGEREKERERAMFKEFRKELDWGGRKLILETGKIARQADGAVLTCQALNSANVPTFVTASTTAVTLNTAFNSGKTISGANSAANAYMSG